MKLVTKEGLNVTTLESYGEIWGKTFKGCDTAMINTGDSSTFSDFIATLREYSDLSEASIAWLEENFFEDTNFAMEVEDGATDYLERHGYTKQGEYYFVATDVANSDRY